jgi:hypothetical protein
VQLIQGMSVPFERRASQTPRAPHDSGMLRPWFNLAALPRAIFQLSARVGIIRFSFSVTLLAKIYSWRDRTKTARFLFDQRSSQENN